MKISRFVSSWPCSSVNTAAPDWQPGQVVLGCAAALLVFVENGPDCGHPRYRSPLAPCRLSALLAVSFQSSQAGGQETRQPGGPRVNLQNSLRESYLATRIERTWISRRTRQRVSRQQFALGLKARSIHNFQRLPVVCRKSLSVNCSSMPLMAARCPFLPPALAICETRNGMGIFQSSEYRKRFSLPQALLLLEKVSPQ